MPTEGIGEIENKAYVTRGRTPDRLKNTSRILSNRERILKTIKKIEAEVKILNKLMNGEEG